MQTIFYENAVHRGESGDQQINDHGYTKVVSNSETNTSAVENVNTNTQGREVNNDEVSTISILETTEVHVPGIVEQVIIY